MDKQEQIYIAQSQKGDLKAFEKLINLHKARVFTLAMRILQQREEAEEAAQDVFIQAFKSMKQFQGKAKFSTWLYKICYHISVDRLKADENRKKKHENVAIETQNAYMKAIDENIVQTEQQAFVQKLLHLLPEEERFIVSLFYFDELSLKEIASVVGITENNAKVKLHRSRNFLQKQLENSSQFIKFDYYE
jgi:RNA polymerase sigma-70 factor (ECF subfamily)